jgi:hypothetical protein
VVVAVAAPVLFFEDVVVGVAIRVVVVCISIVVAVVA